jgi:hypothetical protein
MGGRCLSTEYKHFEDEWKSKPTQVKEYLKAILGVKSKVGARQCSVHFEDCNEFFDAWHIQGSAPGQHIALRFDGRVVAAACFARPNASRGYKGAEGTWELVRFAVGDVGVTGGASKLIKAFIEATSGFQEMVSYSDNRWSSGDLYLKLGFEKVSENASRYWYFKNGDTSKKFHRFGFTKQALEKQGGVGNTEWEMAQSLGWNRIWDCGTVTWVLKK